MLKSTYPYYVVRLVGGLIVLGGMFLMAYNVRRTVLEARESVGPVPVPQPA